MSASKKLNHTFTLLLEGPDPSEPGNLNRLYEAGCDDAIFGERDGVWVADFDREAPTFSGALVSAIAAVEGAVPGLKVVRIEPEELVTASEIASRVHRSRENVRQLFEGARGPGGFPRPKAWLSEQTRLWNWSEVSDWFSKQLDEPIGSAARTRAPASVNALLAFRHFVDQSVPQGKIDADVFRASWLKLGDWIRKSSDDPGLLLEFIEGETGSPWLFDLKRNPAKRRRRKAKA